MHKEDYLPGLGIGDTKTGGALVPGFSRPALLITDMQNFFLDPSSHAFVPSGPRLIPAIARLAELCHSLGIPVLYTRHLNTADDAGMMAVWWRDKISRDDPRSEIHSALSPGENEVVEKTQYDAFHGTNLDRRLKIHESNTLMVTGVLTHLCCETTARSAFVRGYRVVMPLDLTATWNRKLHDASMLTLSSGFASTVPGMELMEELRNAH